MQTSKGVTISGIASSLEALSIGSIRLNITDNNDKAAELQVDRILHLKDLLHTLLSLHQILKQNRLLNTSFALYND